MKKHALYSSPAYSFMPFEVEGFDSLAELALDMRWSWNHYADEIWRLLDPGLWGLTHNPWVVLQTVSRSKLKNMLEDTSFRKKVDELVQQKKASTDSPGWFQKKHLDPPLTSVAYFSMEFMLHEALPIYSGGLGNVAGDQLKAASDLGVPVIGIGLFYHQGYFRQMITREGAQQALHSYNEPGQLPITPLRQPDGEWLRIEIAFPGYTVWLRTWQVQVGSRKLYLLDSNDPANHPAYQGITSELYNGEKETRIKQEIVLGIGGWRLLQALDIHPEVCHLNEGHAAFAVLERTKDFMKNTGQSFDAALYITRSGNVFTTHTAVPAGFDVYPPFLIKQYLEHYAENELGITLDRLLSLGRENPSNNSESFNMAYLAIRGSGNINAVSKLHAKVSRRLFAPLFKRWPEQEIPIKYVTNGVHMPSWDSSAANDLWTHACGKDQWLGCSATLEKNMREVSDVDFWELRKKRSEALIRYARERLAQQLTASGATVGEIEKAKNIFKPEALIIGFARRFATYKRPNLLLHDPERLLRILSAPGRPAQLIIAGKAHPNDIAGQALIKEWVSFIRKPEARPYIIFLSDYDMLLTEHLVQGVDVWINTPRRPWEACGTSGMKVLVNGGLNLSELDGWWAEAYSPNVGWALGDTQEHGSDPAWDALEAEALYNTLEHQVIHEFYSRNNDGIPVGWITKMRESMARLTPRFSADRTVKEYTEKYYLPAAKAYKERAANHGKEFTWSIQNLHSIEQKWAGILFGKISVKSSDARYLFDVEVYLNHLNRDSVKVELYADNPNGGVPIRKEMNYVKSHPHKEGWEVYHCEVEAGRKISDYTPRIIPQSDGFTVPLENNHIIWQR